MNSVSYGAAEMKFTLVYDGRLDSQNSSGIFDKKWEIRQYLAPQLDELWRVHPGLIRLGKYVPKGGYFPLQIHHQAPYNPEEDLAASKARVAADPDNWMDLTQPIDIHGVQFLPLVRESLALSCVLNITFMRKEKAGRVYNSGDMDNRLKTFLDSLKVPKSEADSVARVFPKPTQPIHCLLEDDSLITGLNVESTRLLSSDGGEKNFVRLIVEVDVRVNFPRTYNELFLGD
jgi:hypothetical protein